LRRLVEVSSLTEDCRHGVPLVRRKEDLEQRGGEDVGIDDALTGKSLDQKLDAGAGQREECLDTVRRILSKEGGS